MTPKLVLLATVAVFCYGPALSAEPPEPPEKMRELALELLEGEVPVYYSEGYVERATHLQVLTEAAARYYEKPEVLAVDLDLILAVLDAEDWGATSRVPYGILHVLTDPPTAVLAATNDHMLVNSILEKKDRVSADLTKRFEELGTTFAEAAVTFVDCISFHEMGHLYAHEFGIDTWPATKWLAEFAATYIAYAFMQDTRPELAVLYETMSDFGGEVRDQQHTTLADFEELYLGVGGDNYGWYQCRFLQLISEIYAESGLSFLHTLKQSLAEHPEVSVDDPFRLQEMTAIYPGFAVWSRGETGDLSLTH